MYYFAISIIFNNLNGTIARTAMEAATTTTKLGDKPPRIVDHAQSQTVNDGDAVTLSCRSVPMTKSHGDR